MQIKKVYKLLPAFVFQGKWFNKIPFYKHAVGITIANVVIVHSLDASSTIRHELVHVEQFYRYLGINGIM